MHCASMFQLWHASTSNQKMALCERSDIWIHCTKFLQRNSRELSLFGGLCNTRLVNWKANKAIVKHKTLAYKPWTTYKMVMGMAHRDTIQTTATQLRSKTNSSRLPKHSKQDHSLTTTILNESSLANMAESTASYSLSMASQPACTTAHQTAPVSTQPVNELQYGVECRNCGNTVPNGRKCSRCGTKNWSHSYWQIFLIDEWHCSDGLPRKFHLRSSLMLWYFVFGSLT